jgi:hypothetical protein
MKNIKFKIENHKDGFTIFAAIIVAGVLSIIAFSLSALSSKQVSLATLNRDSGQAIFAANAGVECALYWDSRPVTGSAFATSTASSVVCNGTTTSSGQAIAGTTTLSRIGGGGSANPASTFGFSLGTVANPSQACAIVTVNKYYSGSSLMTHINSYGYNNCDISDPRRVERGIEINF